MIEDLNTLAKRANETLPNEEPGFVSCFSTRSALHYTFNNPYNAEAYKHKRELQGVKFPMIIIDSTIIEERG